MYTPDTLGPATVWHRHSPAQRALRWVVFFAVTAAVVQSLRGIDVIWEFLWDAPEQMRDMLSRMWPVDLAYYPASIHAALAETLHIATLGTLFSTVFALPLALLAAHNITPLRSLNHAARLLLVASRCVNSLVWALLFVAVFGPGPLAGVFAITCRSVGFVGKLMGEALEEVPRGPIEALQAAGASRAAQVWYGHWPAVRPAFWSIMLLRWDINVRESSVLGLVGAGGIGMIMNAAIDTFEWQRVAMILLTILAVVGLAEVAITRVRARLI